MDTIIRSHDHRAALQQENPAAHRFSPVRRPGHDTRILTLRGWRSVAHLNNLAKLCQDNGTPPEAAFHFLGLV